MSEKGHGAGPAPTSQWLWGLGGLALVAGAVAILVFKVDALTVAAVGLFLLCPLMHLFMPHGAGHGSSHGQQADGHHAGASEHGPCCGGPGRQETQPQSSKGATPQK
ncbi:MAG: DUF2933 domain-containing protein [Chloroflexi bacterium]|nr:DUF2933 domain-containing protein [Chloroflexota bacterium]